MTSFAINCATKGGGGEERLCESIKLTIAVSTGALLESGQNGVQDPAEADDPDMGQ